MMSAVLIELLARVGAKQGASVFISERELSSWPHILVTAMKSQNLLTKASPTKSVQCSGCERGCMMPVEFADDAGNDLGTFIICDKRSDVNRVSVTIEQLEQWQISGFLIANAVAKLLNLPPSAINSTEAGRWEIGVLKGIKHASHLVLMADEHLSLSLAGHSIPLTHLLIFDGAKLKVDRAKLNNAVDSPVAAAGDIESAEHRRERLEKRVQSLKIQGIRGFLKAVAAEENISIPRLKQILKPINKQLNSKLPR